MNLLSSFRDSVNWLFCEVPGEASELNSLRLPKSSSVPVDVLVIDISGSMGNEDYPPSRLEGAKTASKGFLDKRRNAQPDAQVGLVTFGDCARVVCSPLPIGTEMPTIRRAVESIDISGSTNLPAGLSSAGKVIRTIRNRRSPRIVLLTDGHSTEGDPLTTAAKIKTDGIQLDIIGIGGSPSEVDEKSLRQMASVVDGEIRYWFIRSVGDLVRRFEFLGLRKCS